MSSDPDRLLLQPSLDSSSVVSRVAISKGNDDPSNTARVDAQSNLKRVSDHDVVGTSQGQKHGSGHHPDPAPAKKS